MLACDRDARILSVGKGVFELTGFQEGELIGKDLREALTLHSPDGEDPVATVLEWGVRKLDQTLELKRRAGLASWCAPTSSPPTTRTAGCSPASPRTPAPTTWTTDPAARRPIETRGVMPACRERMRFRHLEGSDARRVMFSDPKATNV